MEMLKKSIVAFMSACCIMAFSSCFKHIEVVEIDGFSNVELSLKGIKSDMAVRIYNSNPIPFNIKSADIILSVGDIVAGDLVLDESVKLSSRDTTEVIFKLVSRKGAIGEIMVDNFTNAISGSEIKFKAKGEIVSSMLGLKSRLPINYEEKIGQ